MDGRGEQKVELRYLPPNGDAEWFCLDIHPMPEGVLILSRDITDQRRADLKIVDQDRSHLFQAEEKSKRAAELVVANQETLCGLQNIQALYRVDRAIAGSLDINLTLNVIVDQVRSQLAVDAAAVLLLDTNAHALMFASGTGFRSKAIERVRIPLDEERGGYDGLQSRTVRGGHLREMNSPFANLEALADEGFATLFWTPLIAKGQVNGVLEVFHRAPLEPDGNWMDFFTVLASQAAIAVDHASLFTELKQAHSQLGAAYDSTIEGWARALDLRDKETEGHSRRVTEMAMRLAQAAGMTKDELLHVRRGALLHDIGKMGVPDAILLKPDKLTDEEWVVMRKHPTLAFDLLSPIAYLRPSLDIPYCHHERWDGSGYPRGLKAEQIPLAARLFAIVDVWDALRSDRPYRLSWSVERVRENICSESGKHFDPNAADLFLRMGDDWAEEVQPPRACGSSNPVQADVSRPLYAQCDLCLEDPDCSDGSNQPRRLFLQ